jgi:hypothetical protein
VLLRLGGMLPPGAPTQMRLGLYENGRFSACDAAACLVGSHVPVGRSGRKFALLLDEMDANGLAGELEGLFLSDLETEYGMGNVAVDLALRRDKERGVLEISRRGRVRLRWKLPYEVEFRLLTRGLSAHRRGFLGWKLGGTIETGP